MRLCDHLGFLPQLGCFVDELPEPLRARHRRLGVARREREPRVALIGARRVRQGLGPFVARDLVAPAPRCRASSARAPRALAESERALGARGYTRPRRAARERAARRARDPLALRDARALPRGRARGARARAVREAAGLGRRGSRAAAPRSCSSASRASGPAAASRTASGRTRSRPSRRCTRARWRAAAALRDAARARLARPRQSLGDSLPHPLSLLQALLPGTPRVREIAFSTREPAAQRRAALRASARPTPRRARRRSRSTDADRLPRRAALAHRRALRASVWYPPPDYRLCFADGVAQRPAAGSPRELVARLRRRAARRPRGAARPRFPPEAHAGATRGARSGLRTPRRPVDRAFDPRLHGEAAPALAARARGAATCAGAASCAHARATGRPDPEPPALAPISINLDLTTACNYRCDHCIDWDILNTKHRHDEETLRSLDRARWSSAGCAR